MSAEIESTMENIRRVFPGAKLSEGVFSVSGKSVRFSNGDAKSFLLWFHTGTKDSPEFVVHGIYGEKKPSVCIGKDFSAPCDRRIIGFDDRNALDAFVSGNRFALELRKK